MKFNLLAGILLVLLILSLVFGYTQMTTADTAMRIAHENEARALVLKAEADQNAAEAKRQAEIARMQNHLAELARAQAEATLAECRAGKKK